MTKSLTRLSKALATGALVTAVVSGCSSSSEPGANQYEAPSASGAGLATTARTLDDLSANRTTVKPLDLTGQERSIKLTDEWKVCTQSIEPGAAVDFTAEVTLGVVKADEQCGATGYQAKVEDGVIEGITTDRPETKDGWILPEEVEDAPLDEVLETVKENQAGEVSNFQAIHAETVKFVEFSSKYKVCFTSPSVLTEIDPKSNEIVTLFVMEKNRPCISEAEFNGAG